MTTTLSMAHARPRVNSTPSGTGVSPEQISAFLDRLHADRRLNGVDLSVAWFVCKAVELDGVAVISWSTIMKLTGLGRSSVHRSLFKLNRLGLITHPPMSSKRRLSIMGGVS